MNKYENVVILNAELDEEATNKLVAKFSDLINKHGKLLDTNLSLIHISEPTRPLF